MPGYRTKQESIAIAGEADLVIRSLLDNQQHADPLGAAAALGISSAQWPLFGLLWPSGTHLAAQMAAHMASHLLAHHTAGPDRPAVHRPLRILEMGCGLALASLVAHRHGADVTASDMHPLAGAFLLENLRLNGLPPMKFCRAPWLVPPVSAPGDLHGVFDLLIGSDVLYERDADATLARFITRHAAPSAQVWIVDPDRGNRPAFNQAMADRGFDRTEQHLRHVLPAGAATPLHYKGRLLVYNRHTG